MLERILRRDRAVVMAALLCAILLSWSYLVAGAGMAGTMDGMPVHRMAWSPGDAAMMFAMWVVMMLAMMLPAASPLILFHAAITRRRGQVGSPLGRTALFASGYLAVWIAFSIAATAVQWTLDRWFGVSPHGGLASALIAGGVLIAAGVYQLTPLKHACLRRCRSPFDFALFRWREGGLGAFAMGLEHGLYCLGCCWMLMGLLFVGGVMNLLWIGAIALLVLVEKLAPMGHWLGRASGLGFLSWGGIVVAAALLG